MNGGDFRELSRSIGCSDEVLFQTEDGNLHKIHTAIRWQGRGLVLLQEAGAIAGKWPLQVEIPPEELQEYYENQ